MDPSPLRSMGIVLVEQVIDSLPLNQAVGIIHPVLGGEKMIAWTEVVVCQQGHSVDVWRLNEWRWRLDD